MASADNKQDDCGCWVWVILALLYFGFAVLSSFLPQPEFIENPDNKPTTCSVELAGVKGIQPASAPGAIPPAFSLVVHVDNGHTFRLSHGGGDVVVSYAGVPLARGRTPSFGMSAKDAVALPVNATSEGVGVQDDLFRLMSEELRWCVAQLEIEFKMFWESFACDVDLDGGQGQPRVSQCYKPTIIW